MFAQVLQDSQTRKDTWVGWCPAHLTTLRSHNLFVWQPFAKCLFLHFLFLPLVLLFFLLEVWVYFAFFFLGLGNWGGTWPHWGHNIPTTIPKVRLFRQKRSNNWHIIIKSSVQNIWIFLCLIQYQFFGCFLSRDIKSVEINDNIDQHELCARTI